MWLSFPLALLPLLFALLSVTSAWTLKTHIHGRNWNEHFGSEQIHVNNEYVNFLNFDEIRQRGLGQTNGTSFVLRTDSQSVVKPGARGRDSIRVRSKGSWSQGLFIFDIEHMPPQQCGIWPALFLIGTHWPQDGEIDIIEGVNHVPHNQITIHSKTGCAPGVGPGGERGARTGERDCGANGAFVGCGVTHNAPGAYGAGLNAAGGGVYATQWTGEGIRVWQWPRRNAPKDALGTAAPDPTKWGQPVANWGGGCDFPGMFRNLQIVILTTFCGEWAGKKWGEAPGCPAKGSCEQFVGGNPAAFKDAYWKVRSIKVFQ